MKLMDNVEHAMKHSVLVVIPLLLIATALPANACGPDFPNDYLVLGGRDFARFPSGSFAHDLNRIMAASLGKEVERAITTDWSETLSADVEDLRQAIVNTPITDEEKISVTTEYGLFRQSMHDQGEAYREWASAMAQRRQFEANGWKQENPAPERPEPFDLTAYESLLKRLPPEFSFYARGAAAWYVEDVATATNQFQAVLELPADQRVYKGAWAAFMLGRVLRGYNPEAASAAYDRAALLVAESGRDSLGLAGMIPGWKARESLAGGDYLAALHGYAELWATTGSDDREIWAISLDKVCCHCSIMLSRTDPFPILNAIASDSLARRILTAWLFSHYFEESGTKYVKRWCEILQENLPSGMVLEDADRLARVAYESGNMALAEQWVALAPADAPLALWVRAKLAMRAGKAADAEKLLSDAATALQGNDNWPVSEIFGDFLRSNSGLEYPANVNNSAAFSVLADLGLVRLARGEYEAALEAFLKGSDWMDAAYVAERVLALEALAAFAQSETLAQRCASPEQAAALRWLAARRLARAGQWAQALSWYPESQQENAKKLMEALKKGRDASLSGSARAAHLIMAGALTRANGMELLGTEIGPDYFALMGGEFYWDSSFRTVDPTVETLAPTKLNDLAKQNAPSPDKRFHYRYAAASLMWEAAQLLPNNDPLTARALYIGGMYIQKRDPQAADRFYKALVRRNPNLEIAQQADQLRWFPAEFSNKILYRPLHKHGWKRLARNVVLVLAAGLSIGALLAVMRKKKNDSIAAIGSW